MFRLVVFTLICSFYTAISSYAQQIVLSSGTFIENIGKKGKWKVHAGDDPSYSGRSLNDDDWKVTSTHLDGPSDAVLLKGVVWLRYHVKIDSGISNQPLVLMMDQNGASEIWFDGQLVASFGEVSADMSREERYDPKGMPVSINYDNYGDHVIAVRYSNHDAEHSYGNHGVRRPGFDMWIEDASIFQSKLKSEKIIVACCITLACFYLVLALVHFLIWLFYRMKKGNLHYVLFMICLSVFPVGALILDTTNSFMVSAIIKLIMLADTPLIFITLLNLVYHFFYDIPQKRFKWYVITGIGGLVLSFVLPGYAAFYIFTYGFTVTIDTIVTVIKAVRLRRQGSRIIATGILAFTGFLVIAFAILSVAGLTGGNVNLGSSVLGWLFLFLFFVALISIPLSMSIYLAKDFAMTNVSLSHKLMQVEILSRKSIEQEKEKQRILEGQKELLEQQVMDRTSEIMKQKEIIEEKNKSITDSILYALRIQEVLLPTEKSIAKNLDRLNRNDGE